MISGKTRRLIGGLCLALLALGLGCGKGGSIRASISGEVKLDGKPLEQGSILFIPVDGTKGAPAGGPIVGGVYRLSGQEGPAVGVNRVEVQAVRKTGKMVQDPFFPGRKDHLIEMQTAAVAPRFNVSSILKAEVKPGDNTANFEVQSE